MQKSTNLLRAALGTWRALASMLRLLRVVDTTAVGDLRQYSWSLLTWSTGDSTLEKDRNSISWSNSLHIYIYMYYCHYSRINTLSMQIRNHIYTYGRQHYFDIYIYIFICMYVLIVYRLHVFIHVPFFPLHMSYELLPVTHPLPNLTGESPLTHATAPSTRKRP